MGLTTLVHTYGSDSSHASNPHLAVYCAYARLKSFVLLILVGYGSLLTSQPWQRDTMYDLTPGGGAGDGWMCMLNLYIATRYCLQGSRSFFWAIRSKA